MIIYRATLDVPRELAWFAAKLLLAERRKGPWTRDFSHVIPDGKIISCKIGDIARAET